MMDSSQMGADTFGGLVPLYNEQQGKIKRNLHFRSKFIKSPHTLLHCSVHWAEECVFISLSLLTTLSFCLLTRPQQFFVQSNQENQ